MESMVNLRCIEKVIKMLYRKIKLTYILDDEDRFFRTFLVDERMNLKAFGCAILTSLYSTMENDYYFGQGVIRFLPDYLIRKFYEKEDKLISDYTVKDLEDEFYFYYGLDEYAFLATKKEWVEVESEQEIILTDGAGLGIWENNYHTLNSYLLGKLDSNSLEVDYFEEIYPPTNVKIEKYGDFDTNFNLKNLQECFYGVYRVKLLTLDKNEKTIRDNEMTMIIKHQISVNAKIKEVYKKLLTKHDEADVILMMYSKFMQENITAIALSEEFNNNRYLLGLGELN